MLSQSSTNRNQTTEAAGRRLEAKDLLQKIHRLLLEDPEKAIVLLDERRSPSLIPRTRKRLLIQCLLAAGKVTESERLTADWVAAEPDEALFKGCQVQVMLAKGDIGSALEIIKKDPLHRRRLPGRVALDQLSDEEICALVRGAERQGKGDECRSILAARMASKRTSRIGRILEQSLDLKKFTIRLPSHIQSREQLLAVMNSMEIPTELLHRGEQEIARKKKRWQDLFASASKIFENPVPAEHQNPANYREMKLISLISRTAKREPLFAILLYNCFRERLANPSALMVVAGAFYSAEAFDACAKALSLFERYVPTSHDTVKLRFELMRQRGDQEGAFQFLKNSFEGSPGDSSIALMLSKACVERGEPIAALNCLLMNLNRHTNFGCLVRAAQLVRQTGMGMQHLQSIIRREREVKQIPAAVLNDLSKLICTGQIGCELAKHFQKSGDYRSSAFFKDSIEYTPVNRVAARVM